jgi:hypothetical protein
VRNHEGIVALILNINGMRSKKVSFAGLESSIAPQIICLNETKIDDDYDPEEFFLSDYSIYRKDRAGNGGGVLLAVLNDMSSKQLIIPPVASEIVACSITELDLAVVGIYRPKWNRSFVEDLSLVLHSLREAKFNNCCLVGDFNLPLACGTKFSPDFQALLDIFHLTQVVDCPTRGDNILELAFFSYPDAVTSVRSLKVDFSDHNAVIINTNIGTGKPHKSVEFRRYFWDKTDLTGACQYIDERLLSVSYMGDHDTEAIWTFFRDSMLHILDYFVPSTVVRKKIGEVKEAWWPPVLKRQVNKTKRKYRAFVRYRSPMAWGSYVNSYEKTSCLMKSSYQLHLDNISESVEKNPRTFWRRFHDVSNKKVIPPVFSENLGMSISDPQRKVQVFADEFSDIFNVRSEVHRSDDSHSRLLDCLENAEDLLIDKAGILNILNSLDLSKPKGPDGIPPQLLRMFSSQVAEFLFVIFNSSVRHGYVPNDWRTSEIIPVHKKGNKSLVCNYRPISITSIPCKILEHILVSSIYSQISDDRLLSGNQHGFRRGASIETALLGLTNFAIDHYDRGIPVAVISFDLEKAFDSVPHPVLIDRLLKTGINAKIVRWFQSFLVDRKAVVRLDGLQSRPFFTSTGVPQGAVSSPVLFSIFIDCVTAGIENRIGLYADDIVLYGRAGCQEEVMSIQRDIDRVSEWCISSGMRVNAGKTSFMVTNGSGLTETHSFTLMLNGLPLRRVDKLRYLGVNLSHDLGWSDHIRSMVTKAKKVIYFIQRNFRGASVASRNRLYLSLVRPILDFASPIWNPHQKQLIYEIESVQRFAARVVANVWGFGDEICITRLVGDLGWSTLSQRRKETDLCLLFKIVNNLTILDPSTLINSPHYYSRHDHQKKLEQCFYRKTIPFNSFLPRVIREWNCLSNDIVLQDFNEFKTWLCENRPVINCDKH